MNKGIAIGALVVLVGATIWFYKETPPSSTGETPILVATSSVATTTQATTTPAAAKSAPAAAPKPAVKKVSPKPGTVSPGDNAQAEVKITTPDVTTHQAIQVIYDDNGFSPANITVAPGTSVEFKNRSSGLLWVASNPHPTHTGYPGFDAKKAYANGESYYFTFAGAGKTYGFHNHLNTAKSGSVTVR